MVVLLGSPAERDSELDDLDAEHDHVIDFPATVRARRFQYGETEQLERVSGVPSGVEPEVLG